MLILTILCVGFGALSAVFWCWEAAPFFTAVKNIPCESFGDKLSYVFKLIGILPKLTPFVIDLTATVWLAGTFSLGGVIGTMVGLAISDVISVFILTARR